MKIATHRKIQHLNSSRRLFIQLAIACFLLDEELSNKVKLETRCKRNIQIVQIIIMLVIIFKLNGFLSLAQSCQHFCARHRHVCGILKKKKKMKKKMDLFLFEVRIIGI